MFQMMARTTPVPTQTQNERDPRDPARADPAGPGAVGTETESSDVHFFIDVNVADRDIPMDSSKLIYPKEPESDNSTNATTNSMVDAVAQGHGPGVAV